MPTAAEAGLPTAATGDTVPTAAEAGAAARPLDEAGLPTAAETVAGAVAQIGFEVADSTASKGRGEKGVSRIGNRPPSRVQIK